MNRDSRPLDRGEVGRVPVMLPRLATPDRVAARLQRIHLSGWYSNHGPQVVELEGRYAQFLEVPAEHVVVVANATLGLQGAVAISGKRTWAVPSFSFPAAAAAVLHAGRDVQFVDVRAEDWWLDIDVVPRRSGAIGLMPVAPFGAGVRFDLWDPDAEVIIDAAASLGANTPALGSLPQGWAVVFSLHATKVLAAGEGGIVVFGDPERAERMRAWMNFGFEGSSEATTLGTNAKMTEVTAAYAHAALDTWQEEQAEWQSALAVTESIAHAHGIGVQPGHLGGVRPYWIATFPDEATTDVVCRVLTERGIATRRWWARGCHRMRAFSGLPCSQLSVTDGLSGTYLGLPLFRDLDRDDGERIYAALAVARQQARTW